MPRENETRPIEDAKDATIERVRGLLRLDHRVMEKVQSDIVMYASYFAERGLDDTAAFARARAEEVGFAIASIEAELTEQGGDHPARANQEGM